MNNNNGKRSKYDMASLLGSETCPADSQPPGQQLPKLAFVLEKNGGVSTPTAAPPLSTQTMKQERELSVKAPTEQTVSNIPTKRRASECEDEDEKDAMTPTPKRCRGKWRKPTYLVRKEEKCELLEHIKELESQVSFLQNRTNIVAWQEKDRQQIETEIKNNVLRNSVKQQQLRVLSAQSAMSELTHAVHDRCFLETYIHLGLDWAKRTDTLTSLRAQQCRDAAELVEKRTQFMTEAQGLKTVKEAFEFIQFYIKHMDTKPMNSKYTCTSELGPDKNVMHRRLIISEVENVTTETNFVMFSEQRPSNGDPGESIDQGVMRKLVKTPTGEDEEVPAVVLTRWMLQKLRCPELPVPKHVLQTMRDRINEPGNAILRAVKEARAPVQLEAKDIKVLGV
ncbi:hypothetical protein PI124_g4955 [Phytophthora idaei]|nr:hypothetical protein PI125_g4536 [Phytophthora idaei]KAG3159825.1 hypothetical protein PI126_g7187 [Phytophthora idaei]KAG3250381.1 hypothetical protein PI124_g4955 [Phytophthora idaei]